jgi:hypothetical protein
MTEQRKVIPSRLLFDPDKESQLQWVNHASTDIRTTFARVRAEMLKKEAPSVAQLRKTKK